MCTKPVVSFAFSDIALVVTKRDFWHLKNLHRLAVSISIDRHLFPFLSQVAQEIHVQLSEMSDRCNELVSQNKVRRIPPNVKLS